jgi:hypothetical protein
MLRLPDFHDFRHYEGVKVVTPTHRPSLPPGVFLVLIFKGWVDPRAHGSVGSYGKNPQRHHWESIPRPSDWQRCALTTILSQALLLIPFWTLNLCSVINYAKKHNFVRVYEVSAEVRSPVFWGESWHRLLSAFQHFEETFCYEECNTFLRNVENHLPNEAVTRPRIPKYAASLISTTEQWTFVRLKSLKEVIFNDWGTRQHCWLRHCVTSLKVAGSNPDGVCEIFHWYSFRPHYSP